MDLNAPEGESEDEELHAADAEIDQDGVDGFGNTNDIKYKDFFAHPLARSRRERKADRARGGTAF